MKRHLSCVAFLVVSFFLVFSSDANAQCSGGAGPQTGLGAVSCTGAPAWTGQAVAAGQAVTYNNCLYRANQAVAANESWCPGCSGIFLYGNGAACPAAGCNYGAEGTCGSVTPTATPTATATPTSTTPPRRATPTSTTPTGCAIGAACQAETALLGGGVVTSTLHAGYTGTGFADYQGNGTGFVEWTVSVPTAGNYNLNIRYGNGGTGDRPMSIQVNGTTVVSSMSFPVTGWTSWTVRTQSVSLPAGSVRIRATELPNGPNVDSLTVSAGATPTATATVRATATPTTRATATSTTPPVGCAIGAACQAETALLGGGVVVSTLHAGYTGTGFADYAGNGTGFIEWTVNVPSAGTYTLNIRYGNGGTGDRPMAIAVNGTTVVSSLSFPVTGWTTWTVRSQGVSLPAGSVRIRATELPNGPNVDSLTVSSGATPTATSTTRPTATATSTATPTTRPTVRPTATPTTCTGCGTLPKHLVTGYWHNWNAVVAPAVLLRDVPMGYTIIAVAFAEPAPAPAGAGSITFNMVGDLGYANVDQFKADIALVHGRGQKVIISVGGANSFVSVANSTEATNFANTTVALMNSYGFAGVDIDIEGGSGINPPFMAQALQSVAAQKPGAIITMAPETLFMLNSTSTYLDLAIRVKNILTVVNTQYYNSGGMLDCNGNGIQQGTVDFMTGMACTAIRAGLRPDQVGLGLPATPAAAGSGYVDPSVVNRALDCLARGTNCGNFQPPAGAWPTIRGAMTWSINYDKTQGYAWVNSVSAHLATLP